VASGANNIVSFYQWLDLRGNKVFKGGKFIVKRDYMGYITQLGINDTYAAVLSDGKCTLHYVDPSLPDAVADKYINYILYFIILLY
jgi:hypothetical protein